MVFEGFLDDFKEELTERNIWNVFGRKIYDFIYFIVVDIWVESSPAQKLFQYFAILIISSIIMAFIISYLNPEYEHIYVNDYSPDEQRLLKALEAIEKFNKYHINNNAYKRVTENSREAVCLMHKLIELYGTDPIDAIFDNAKKLATKEHDFKKNRKVTFVKKRPRSSSADLYTSDKPLKSCLKQQKSSTSLTSDTVSVSSLGGLSLGELSLDGSSITTESTLKPCDSINEIEIIESKSAPVPKLKASQILVIDKVSPEVISAANAAAIKTITAADIENVPKTNVARTIVAKSNIGKINVAKSNIGKINVAKSNVAKANVGIAVKKTTININNDNNANKNVDLQNINNGVKRSLSVNLRERSRSSVRSSSPAQISIKQNERHHSTPRKTEVQSSILEQNSSTSRVQNLSPSRAQSPSPRRQSTNNLTQEIMRKRDLPWNCGVKV